MQSLACPFQLRVIGIVQRLQIVVVALRHHFVLQQFLGALQLQIGASGFNLGLLEIGARLRSVAALQQCRSVVPCCTSWPGSTLSESTASADRRIDMHHSVGLAITRAASDKLIRTPAD